MLATRPWKVPINFVLTLCTALLLSASAAFATPTSQVVITKSSDAGATVTAGQTITFTIDVACNGPNGCPQTVIKDDFSTSGATFINITPVATVPDNCAVVGQVVTCSVQGIGSAGSVDHITITAEVDPSTPKDTEITNCAVWVSGNYTLCTGAGAPAAGCPGASVTTGCATGFTVVESADMEVVKTQTDPLPANNPVPGATNVTYRIVATNNGPSTATNVSVGDNITVGSATFVSATPVAPNSNGLDCSGFTAFPGSCTVASLASGESVSFDLVVTAPNDGTSSITDTATVSSDTSDPNTDNNTSSVTTTVCQSVDLAITKTCETFCPPVSTIQKVACVPETIVDPIPGGTEFTYHIVITNNDPDNNADNVILDDALPAGVSLVGTNPPTPCVSGSIATNDCNLGTILATASDTIDIFVTAVESGPVENTASVSADQCDRNTSDNSSSCSVTVLTNNMPTELEADREGSGTTVSDVNRVFEPGETVRVDPAWTNTLNNDDPDVTGTASTFAGPAGGTYNITDDSADYGAIPANSQSDCNGITATSPSSTGTGNCYEMQVLQNDPNVRPNIGDHPRHWDTTFHETLSSGETKTWTLHIGDTFLDVPRANGFYRFIETILHNHITVGCGDGTDFCPTQSTQRAQMAAFIARSLAGNDASVPTSGTGWDCVAGGDPSQFTDVEYTSGFCKHVNYLKDQKVTQGCTPTTFCPLTNVSRGSMAVFIARAVEVQDGNTADPDGSIPLFGNDTAGTRQYNCDSVDHQNTVTLATIPAGTPAFSDVPTSGDVCKSTGFLYIRHIVDGFLDGTFHPTQDIRRDQEAKILSSAFVKLPLYGPLTF